MYVPAIGQTLSRDFMPQIKDPYDFLDELELHGIAHATETLDPRTLKSTQSDFDANKVFQMMQSHGETRPIIVSNDGYVLDGHHRWLAAYNKLEKVEARVCKAPILDLLHHAKRYVVKGIGIEKTINESIEHKTFGPMLDSFVKFASDKLGLKSLPNIRIKDEGDNFNSFACYHPGKKHIVVSIKNRHPMDVFRSVAHELVHQYQDETNALYDGAGETGSPIEDEANYLAGRIMRHWAKQNPEHFKLKPIFEAVFVVGGPCSGKDRVARYLKELYDAKEVDVQNLNEDFTKKTGGNFIVNASADQLEMIEEARMNLEEGNGYYTTMYFVDTTNEISKLRNEARAEKGQRVLSEGVRFAKFAEAQKSKQKLAEMFRRDFYVIDNSIQEAANEVKVKIQVDQPKKSPSTKKATKTSSKPAPKATKPKTDPDPDKVKMDLEALKHKQKFQLDTEARKAEQETKAKEVNAAYHQQRALEFQERIQAVRDAMRRLQPIGTNYQKVHKQLKQQLAGAILGMRKWQKETIKQYNSPKEADLNEQFENMMEHAGEWGTDELRINYQKDTPGQPVGFEEPYRTYLPKHIENYLTQVRGEPSKPEEPNIPQMPDDSIGSTVATSEPVWPQNRAGTGGIGAVTEAWMNNPKTIERFKARYKDNWEQKIMKTAKFLDAQKIEAKPKSLRAIQEAIDKGVGDMGTVPNQGKEEQIPPVEECGPLNSKAKSAKRNQ